MRSIRELAEEFLKASVRTFRCKCCHKSYEAKYSAGIQICPACQKEINEFMEKVLKGRL